MRRHEAVARLVFTDSDSAALESHFLPSREITQRSLER
jgi:hypothetical protein